MDAFMEKLGIYDLIAVLMTGIIVMTVSIITDAALIKSGFTVFINNNDKMTFLVLSYFIGVILQESTSLIYRALFFQKNKLLNQVFTAKNILDYYITEKEIKKLRTLIAEKLDSDVEIDNVYIYNMCNAGIAKLGYGSRVNLDQAIAGLSRSLSFYFIFLAATMFVLPLRGCNAIPCLISAAISSAISVLLFFRYVRFTKMRYSYILRNYLYNCLN